MLCACICRQIIETNGKIPNKNKKYFHGLSLLLLFCFYVKKERAFAGCQVPNSSSSLFSSLSGRLGCVATKTDDFVVKGDRREQSRGGGH